MADRPLDDFGPRSWARPECVGFGRLPTTTFLRSDIVSLDGDWSFRLFARPEDVSRAALTGDVAAWPTVEVPGCWTMQGHGLPHYTNVQMPFAGPPPQIPEANPTGIYRRTIKVPPAWADQRVVLHVGGVETVLYVHVDGQPVAMGTDSRLPQEVDLTGLVAPDRPAEVALTVVRWSAATYLEDQDHWHHAGLHRSVFLYATPVVHLADVHPTADLDPASGTGHLRVRVTTGPCPAPPPKGWTVRVALDGDVPVAAPARWEHPTSWVANMALFEGRGAVVELVVPGVAPWTAETPALHGLAVELVDGDGAVRDRLCTRVGFRRVEVDGHRLLVNGVPITVRGVNRHDHDPTRGKAVTRASIRHDLELMKAHNLNAVRTSHYPSDAHLYDLCDELGLYVVDEADIESHAYLRSLTKDPVWSAAILARVTRMALRDKGHPSVIIWSLGNESGSSPAIDAAATWLRSFDPGRPVQYEGGLTDDALAAGADADLPAIWRRQRRDTDLIVPMYPTVEDLVRWATASPPERPLIICEYAHAMGNAGGGLDTYWDAIRAHAGLQGGFIWDWVDQAILQVLPDGTRRWAYGGDLGDEPNDGAFCCNGLVAADRTAHPALLEAKAVLAPIGFTWADGAVIVTNRHDHIGLGHLRARWAVSVDGDEVATGPLVLPELAPGASASVPAPAEPPPLVAGQVAHLTVRVTAGVDEVAAWQVELARQPWGGGGRGATVDLDGFEPQLCLWRAPTDNEVFGRRGVAARWAAQGLGAAHERIPLVTTVVGDVVTHEVVVPEDLDDVARVGVRLRLPSSVVDVEWVGRGPHECYSDRQVSAIVGRWLTPVDDWPVAYVHPQASGNRTGVRRLRFLDAAGDEVLTIDRLHDLDVTVSRWTDEQVHASPHRDELPRSDDVWVWLDAAHRGVGTGACGPDTAPDHRVATGSHRWSYQLRTVGSRPPPSVDSS